MSFDRYIKTPSAPGVSQGKWAQRDAQVSALSKQPADVLVAMLLKNPERYGIPHLAIAKAGPRVVPALLDAVDNPEYRGGDHVRRFTRELLEPLEGVLLCLAEYAPPEAVPVISPLSEDNRKNIREEVALLLGSIGTEEAAFPVCRLLADKEESVRSSAMMGILQAVEAGRVEAGFSNSVFEAIEPLTFRREYAFRRAAKCLLALDRERAIDYLVTKDGLNSDRDGLDHVLRALRESEVSVPEEYLLSLLSDLEDKATEHPAEQIVGEVLGLVASEKPDTALQAIERCSEHPSQHIRECAAEAKAEAIGIHAPFKEIKERFYSSGWESLLTFEKHALAVRMLVDEVKNGGFLQYFVHDSGNYWREAASGLAAIGATADRELLDKAVTLFGSHGPSTDRYERHQQVAIIVETNKRPFESIEREFFKDKQDREVLLLQYMVNHRDADH